jgi:tetratricopeptide (TPR) repeat protein
MPAPEYAVYNNALTQTDPKAKAAGLEQYLTQFPQSCVKLDTLVNLMITYSAFDTAKTMDAADRVLKLDPNNLSALIYEVYLHKVAAGAITDPDPKKAAAAQQPQLDEAASYSQRGLAAPKPAAMPDADFKALQAKGFPLFYTAIGNAAFNKNDFATAIDAFKKELTVVPPDATKTPGGVLLDIYYLGASYYQSTPPDYLNCTFYASRAAAFAPEPPKASFLQVAKYCYHQYHGSNDEGYDSVVAAATANLNPPDGFFATIKPKPTPADYVNQVIATTPDLSVLAIDDKEFILQNGTPEQAAKVWDTLKGKSYQIPGSVVAASTPTQLQVEVSEGAKASKTADFTVNLTAPDPLPEEPKAPAASATPAAKAAYKTKLAAYNKAKAAADATAAATAVGQTITVAGTYDSFAPNPIMITLTGGEVILAKAAPAPKAPVARRPAAGHK